MTIEVGKTYWYRSKNSNVAQVRRILKIDGERAAYETLHGPLPGGQRYAECKTSKFSRWKEIDPATDFHTLDGAILYPTSLVLSYAGKPIFRCSHKRAQHYLKKGYVTEAGPGVIQFTNDTTENRLVSLYGTDLHEFFMQVKNDRCVVCGAAYPLTRHHVIPKRRKQVLSLKYRCCLSNILFVCVDCHKKYEEQPEPQIDFEPNESDETFRQFCDIWQNHFIELMKPKFIPAGWSLITVKNFDAVLNTG